MLWSLLIAAVLGVCYLLYMLIFASENGSMTFSDIIAFTMAMGNTYGMLLLTVLLGSGLASLPKRLWQLSNPTFELNRLYLLTMHVEEAFEESRFLLEDAEDEVQRAVQYLEAHPYLMQSEVGKYIRILQVYSRTLHLITSY